jgi:hypothetical protein
VAHDRLISLTDSDVPGDEDEVHDVISYAKDKDAQTWTAQCMSDNAKEAPCVIQAESLADADNCNGALARPHWTARVTDGECVAMISHMADVGFSAGLEGRELDEGVRTQILNGVEGNFDQDMEDGCIKLAHADVACFLDARDMDGLHDCADKLRKNSPEFIDKILEAAGQGNSMSLKAQAGGHHANRY